MQRNLKTFIASIYMNSRKVLKGKNANSLLSIYDGKGEHLEEEVMQIVEITTRWRGESPRTRLRCLNHEKDPQPESLETLR